MFPFKKNTKNKLIHVQRKSFDLLVQPVNCLKISTRNYSNDSNNNKKMNEKHDICCSNKKKQNKSDLFKIKCFGHIQLNKNMCVNCGGSVIWSR